MPSKVRGVARARRGARQRAEGPVMWYPSPAKKPTARAAFGRAERPPAPRSPPRAKAVFVKLPFRHRAARSAFPCADTIVLDRFS